MGDTGELIRKLRRAREVSQFDLELAIDAGFGSISKIERGIVEPTKPTLARIIRTLKLPPHEIMALYGIDLDCYRNVIGSINKIYEQGTLADCLQTVVDEISRNLNLVGVSILLVEGNKLVYKVTSNEPYKKRLLNLIREIVDKISYELNDPQPSPQVQAILSKQLVLSTSLYECFKPHLSKPLADIIIKLIGVEVIGFLPIIHDTPAGEKAVGVITFAVKESHIVEKALPLMYGYLDSAAIAISKFQKYGENR